jgi:hypothetical protein
MRNTHPSAFANMFNINVPAIPTSITSQYD